MEFSAFQSKITELLPQIVLRFDEPMAKHTSFRIGGPAAVMAFPKNPKELAEILRKSDLLDCNLLIMVSIEIAGGFQDELLKFVYDLSVYSCGCILSYDV